MKSFLKNVFGITMILLVCFSVSIQTIYGAQTWLFSTDTANHDFGPYQNTGYATQADCETARQKTASLGHTTSAACYTADPVKITGVTFDPGATGQVGDFVTITGANFFNVTNVLFGTISSTPYPQANDTTKLRAQVPAGATTGKITVVTQYRGSATSTSVLTFAAAPANNNLWYFKNAQAQFTGGDTTQDACNTRLAAYLADPANGITDKTGYACSQQTPDIVAKSQSTDTPAAVNAQTGNGTDSTYTLLAPIGDLKTVSNTGTCASDPSASNGIGCYLNTIFKIGIGLCGALAVIMIVIGGIQYMGTESVFGKTEAKGRIMSSILGLFIALGAYALLYTINPDLTGQNGVSVDQVSADIQDIEYVPTQTYEKITGTKTLSPSQYDSLARTVAKQVGIPACAMEVILQRESRGNPGAIGFDENVTNPAIPSRVAFVNSGKKYSGESFVSSSSLITQKSFKNQSNNSVTDTPGLGLDWRFSKGLGLTQITLFPANYFSGGYKTNPPSLATKDNYPTYNGFTPKDLLDPQKNLTAGAQTWKKFWLKCNKNIYNTWSAYGSGSCTAGSDYIKKEAQIRTDYYNSCPAADKNV